MTASLFDTPDAPGSGDRFVNADHLGELLVVKVKALETGIETSAGTSDVIVADVTVCDGPREGTEYADAWLFGKVLVGQLKRKVGKTIVGRFVQGAKQPGKTPPWQLDPATEADTATALRVMTAASRPDAASADGASGGDDDAPPWSRR